jgi:hypothetical protein
MADEEKENQTEVTQTEKDFSSELNESRWSVISFETCVAESLTYAQAEQKMKELEAARVSGLCIVTNETAERISK